MRSCSVEGCEKRVVAGGMCDTHYRQVKRYGEIISLGRNRSEPNPVEFVGEDAWISLYDRRGNVVCKTVVDADKYDIVKNIKWSLDSWGYARRTCPNLFMHRLVIGFTGRDLEVDHIDRDKLNNRVSNLRLVTTSQNQHNVSISKKNTSGFKGVCRYKKIWQAFIGHEGKQIYLGHFDTPEEASLAYDNAATILHGEFAVTNRAIGASL